MNTLIERLKEIKIEQSKLSVEKADLVSKLNVFEAYQNDDGTWTRYTNVDRIEALKTEGKFLSIDYFDRFQTKIEILKNKPKELN